ncbi:MAG: DUF3857 domain-containing protein [Bergeyella sp.]
MSRFYALLMLGFFVSAFSQYSSLDIPEELKKNANAVIRDEIDEYTLKSVDDMLIVRKSVVTILDKSGEDYSAVMIPYDPSTKVSNIKVNVYNAFGQKQKSYSRKDFSDYTNNRSNALYVDDRILFLKIGSTGYPFTVETTYEVNTSNTIKIGTFVPFGRFGVSTQNTVFRIINNAGIKIRKKITDNEIAKVSVYENGNISEYRYAGIPAVKEENYAPAFDFLVPKVEFSPEKFSLEGSKGDLTSWNDFGKWYYSNLLTPVSQITPEISQEINALNLTGTKEEKVKKIYQYMQEKTRYVLIAMGIGGWKPMPASEVSKKGYGDCKALTNYMRTLLSAAGIESYYAVIYDNRTEQKFDKNFPELNGNHVVLMVPGENGNIWLENTSQKMAFNHLSFTSHNRNVLLVKENGIEIVDTPVYKPEQSKEILRASVKLSEDAGISSVIDLKYTGGQYDGNLALFGMKSEEIKEAVKKEYFNLKMTDLKVDKLFNDRDKAEITYEISLNAKDFSKKLGNDMFFPVMPFGINSTLVAGDERILPFETPFPYQNDYHIEYEAPAGYVFSEVPESVQFESEFGSYKMNFEVKDGKLYVHRSMTMNKGLYPKEKYKDYAAFRKKAAGNDNAKILITKR